MHKVVFLVQTCQTALRVNHKSGTVAEQLRSRGSFGIVHVCVRACECWARVNEWFVQPCCPGEDQANVSFIYGLGEVLRSDSGVKPFGNQSTDKLLLKKKRGDHSRKTNKKKE